MYMYTHVKIVSRFFFVCVHHVIQVRLFELEAILFHFFDFLILIY